MFHLSIVDADRVGRDLIDIVVLEFVAAADGNVLLPAVVVAAGAEVQNIGVLADPVSIVAVVGVIERVDPDVSFTLGVEAVARAELGVVVNHAVAAGVVVGTDAVTAVGSASRASKNGAHGSNSRERHDECLVGRTKGERCRDVGLCYNEERKVFLLSVMYK